ncbi:MAG: alpha-N-arabinofuranosidase [Chloroflexota bacterium]|nr:alpha-N-arabinofuranosidase [Chloroflexota bacterium]
MARVRVDLDRTLGRVDERIFGGFIEHVGRCIYGGIYDEGSPLSDARGFRTDVLDAIKQLRVPVLRWPGGNFVSGYHWTDGVGPADERPRRRELAWHAIESNRFGTDEFIAYCRALGAEPYICVNMGTGTIDEAANWVEYCNGTGDTYWADLRRRNGHPEPYNVKYWGLGNEMWGGWQIGALSAEDYVKKAREFAKVMRWTDPSIELVGCGHSGLSDWDRIVLVGLAPFVHHHAIHIYTGSNDFARNVFAPHQAERALRVCQALIDQTRFNGQIQHEITVAYDEWNVWFRARKAETGLEEPFTLSDALAVATFLNIFVRACRTVGMANLAQLVNAIAAITTSPDGLFYQAIYHPFRLLAQSTQRIALDAWVESPTMTLEPEPPHTSDASRIADLGPFSLLDVAATRDETRSRLTLSIVNRSADAALATAIELSQPLPRQTVTVAEVNGDVVDVPNSFAHPDVVSVRESHIDVAGDRVDLNVPAHAHVVMTLELGS